MSRTSDPDGPGSESSGSSLALGQDEIAMNVSFAIGIEKRGFFIELLCLA